MPAEDINSVGVPSGKTIRVEDSQGKTILGEDGEIYELKNEISPGTLYVGLNQIQSVQ